MFKVLVWDYVGISTQWIKQFADRDIKIVGTMTPQKNSSKLLLKRDAWDWLLIFEQGSRNFFESKIQSLKLPPDRVIYALDITSWRQHPKAAFVLTNPEVNFGKIIRLHLNLDVGRQLGKFLTCTVEGISYVARSNDKVVMYNMYTKRINWASQDMKRFHALAKKYYKVDDGAGYFFDLGANIGTTGIYFIKKLAPNLKLLAFEPDAENFKMHRVNLILNDLEDRATLVNCGLGDKFDDMTMYRDADNPGGNSVVVAKDSQPTETIKIMPLDAYIAEQHIAPAEVKYIWIDTEGFEPQVMLGAKNLLKENPVPIFTECNLHAWKQFGRFDELMTLLAESYSHFVLLADGKETLYPLEALRTINLPTDGLGQIGDIFLIKKGLIN